MIKDTQVPCSPQILCLTGRMTGDTVKELSPKLITRKPTVLFIDSVGGDFDSGSMLAGAILSNGKVAGVVTGQADSMAIPVFQACRARLMLDYATMFFHSGDWSPTLPNLAVFDEQRIERLVSVKRELETAYEEMILKGVKPGRNHPEESSLSLEKIREWRRKEFTLTAKDAHDYGLCDTVTTVKQLFAEPALKELMV